MVYLFSGTGRIIFGHRVSLKQAFKIMPHFPKTETGRFSWTSSASAWQWEGGRTMFTQVKQLGFLHG